MAQFDEEKRTWYGRYRPSIFNPRANLGQVLINVLERTPEKIAQVNVDTGTEVSCKQLRRRSVRFAKYLANCGFEQGEVVALVTRNSCHVSAVTFGCFLAGITLNTLDPSFDLPEIQHMLRLTRPKMIVCDFDRLLVIRTACTNIELQVDKYGLLLLESGNPLPTDCFSVDELVYAGEATEQNQLSEEDSYIPPYWGDSTRLTAAIVCSSGTTGLPKAVRVSHAQLIALHGRISQLDQNDTILCFSTLYWISGFQMLLTGTFNGIRRLITAKPPSAAYTIELCNRYQVTILLATPSLATDIVQALPETARLESLKVFIVGGSVVPLALRKSLNRHVLVEGRGRCLVAYGLSETGGGVSFEIEPREQSVGALASECAAKIISDDGMPLDAGVNGELLIRPAYPFLGYYGDEEATRQTLDDEGFVRTGDIAYFDRNGLLYLVDRKRDILKYGGYQITPATLEATISELPGVRHVAVVGIPDPDRPFDDLATALIVRHGDISPALTEEMVIKHCTEQNGGEQSRSECYRLRGGVRFVDCLPMTENGKVIRSAARKLAITTGYCSV
uniref:AMP-dependent synthetase/ligase domain-containing protein n=1 Tax=Anopheles albimanus TaxID=7167 RepID=A0A182FJ69_ANOAL